MKQSYASLVAFVFFLGVPPTASFATVQESLSQAFSMNREGASAWSELGLGGDDLNLQVIESSLMSMVKEGTSPSLRPGIMAIYNLTNDMKAALVNHSAFLQNKLNDSFNRLQECNTLDNEGQERFNFLRTILTECQLNHTSYYHCHVSCATTCEAEANRSEELRRLLCLKEPYNCEMQVVALDDNRAVKNQIFSLRAHFDGLRNSSVDCNATRPNCSEECVTNCSIYVETDDNCTTDVCGFEETGCFKHHHQCSAYNDCYDTRAEEYNVTLGEVQCGDAGAKSEYRAITRIQCLLNAFLVSIDDVNGTGLDQGINYCINRTYYEYFCKCNSCPVSALQDPVWNAWLGSNATRPADSTSMCSNNYERGATSTGCDDCAQPWIPNSITYPVVATVARKNCTSADFPTAEPPFDVVPGTDAWQNRYYSHWPVGTILPNCQMGPEKCQLNVSWNGVNEPNLTSSRRDLDSSNPYIR